MKAEYAVFSGNLPFRAHDSLQYKPLHEGEVWGRDWESAMLHITCDIPEEWQNKPLAISLVLSGETLLFDRDGVPFWAFTGNCIFQPGYVKDFFIVDERIREGNRIDFWCESTANAFGGKPSKREPSKFVKDREPHCEAKLEKMQLGVFNRDAWALYTDFEILHNLYRQYDPEHYRARQLLTTLNEAVNVYGYNSANAPQARAVLRKELSRPAVGSAPTASAIGHAHIDVAWFWPVRESMRKAARTFACQIELLRKYPDYIFGASQPLLYAFVRDNYPELYDKVKQAVADGRWEPLGGMWVEADCNIISGESMIRQFLYGKNFFRDEFGIEVKNLWLPDVFGYSANLPQIIRKSGCDYFLTQKISWNQFNKFPYHTFLWSGIDGSSVLTHFPPENNYNASMTPADLVAAQNRFAEVDFIDEFASLFGLGDGGSGPSDLFLERAERLRDLEGVPKVKFSRAEDFFNRIGKYRDRLNHWHGELYLELHRGTLTSQGRTKFYNRRLEQLLCSAEIIFSSLPLSEYPREALDRIWKMLLTNQFHDILPGSSIREVYEVTEKEMPQAEAELDRMIQAAAEKFSERDENAITLINTLGDAYRGVVDLPDDWRGHRILADGKVLNVQSYNGKTTAWAEIPAMSSLILRKGEKEENMPATIRKDKVLENALIRYAFNDDGLLVSAYDKTAARELVPAGIPGNVLCVYVDRPNFWDAWDVELFYRDEVKTCPEIIRIGDVCQGEVCSFVEMEFRVNNSAVKQRCVLGRDTRRLDFVTEVDWREEHSMLRVSFGADIRASEASYDIQYGFVKRPLHENTSWELAKFEVPSHKYFDLSEKTYGVALLNNGKYGCRAWSGKLDLALLRSPIFPDYKADQGRHEFIYSYLPHENCLEDSNVMQEAAALNRPAAAIPGYAGRLPVPVVAESENVSLEIIKKAEKSDDLVIRLVESRGRKGSVKIKFNPGAERIVETNLIEWTEEKTFIPENNELVLDFNPFEIRTFRICRKQF